MRNLGEQFEEGPPGLRESPRSVSGKYRDAAVAAAAALDLIIKTCSGSRTRTRRIRYIEEIAAAALKGRKVNPKIGVPSGAPEHIDITEARRGAAA